MLSRCIHCGHKIVYHLQNGHIKCAKCKKKYSPQKFEKNLDIIKGFCNDSNALELSKQLKISYSTVLNTYKDIRMKIALFCQYNFENHETHINEYDEYLYLPANKKKEIEHLFEAQNFIIFDYGKIYTLMLPFSSKYSNFSDSPEELKKFLTYNKIAKLKNQDNNINGFCNFFESNIKKYKGMENENFVYYLKELEFKFNYQINERYNIVIKLMYDSITR